MGTLGDRHTGIGMTSDRTRARMVERLRSDGIRDEVVLAAMNAVPRHIFVDEALAIRAYDDVPLPIGHGQTISQPWVVARMTELARNGRALDAVLEIGTGCGYQTAVLAQIAHDGVHGRAHPRAGEQGAPQPAGAEDQERAAQVRRRQRRPQRGHRGRRDRHRCRRRRMSRRRCLRYLKPGGRMVLPLAASGDGERGVQRLTVIESTAAGMREHTYDAVRFVPLLSGLS